MSRKTTCSDTNDGDCYYCLEPIVDTPKNHQHDHFPVPYRLGGTEVVCVCEMCHKLVDTINLDNWPSSKIMKGMVALMDSPPEARLLMAKMIKVAMDVEAKQT